MQRFPAGPGAPGVPPHAHGPERAELRPIRAYHLDLSAMFPRDLFLHGPRARKEVALTFDDGPDYRFTPRVLETLARLDVKATFFVVGQRAAAAPTVLQEIVRQGHAYGNHTYHHVVLPRLDADAIRAEVENTDEEIARVTGRRTRLFRPPYGSLSPRVVEEIIRLRHRLIFWSVDSLDWMGLTRPQVTAGILGHAGPGDIILQHSAGGAREDLSGTVAAIPYVVNSLREMGYRFVTVPELLGMEEWLAPV